MALGVTLVLALSGLGTWLYNQAGAKTPVVVMAADVPAGHRIERGDLSTVDVAGGITAVAGDHLDSIVGQTAAVPLLRGTVLMRSMVTSSGPLTGGLAAVGVALKGGQLPADGLSAGDVVAVLEVPTAGSAGPAGADATQAQVLVDRARVFSSRADPAQAGGTLVTVLVPTSDLVPVAVASGAGQVSLVEVASR